LKATSLAILLTLAVSPASAETVFPAFGGVGDHRLALNCAKGEYIVGFKGRAGGWIDRITLICAAIVRPAVMGPHRVVRSEFGGMGGAPAQIECPDGLVRQVRGALTPDKRMVQAISFSCNDPRTGALTRKDLLVFTGGASGATNLSNQCLQGEAATGLQVNFGKHVNAVGLICDRVHLP
jgi:hypothetical protein